MNINALRGNSGSATNELVDSLSDAAGVVVKVIEETAAPIAEMIEARANMLAKSVEDRTGPLVTTLGTTVEALAKSAEERAAPVAQAVSEKAGAVTDDLEEKLGQARKEIARGVKEFRFGQREALVLGLAAGVFAAVWLIRKVDRQAAAARLRAAGARAGEAAQGLTSRVGEATQGLAGKAGTLADQAGERVGQVVERVRSQGNGTLDEAKHRLSGAAAGEQAGSGLDAATRAAISDAVEEVEQVQQEAQAQARELGLSNGMKVVAFDGTDIGRVQEVREDAFVLDRPKGSDLLVPLTEVARIEGTVAYLRIDVGQVTKMGWEKV